MKYNRQTSMCKTTDNCFIRFILAASLATAGLTAHAWAADHKPADKLNADQGAVAVAQPVKSLAELQLDLVNLRFGMFIHFNPCTFLDPADRLMWDHAPPRQGKDGILGTADDLSPGLFNPRKLDCGQWADAAKSAGMKFGVLTTKHHDGFCLWPSKYSN